MAEQLVERTVVNTVAYTWNRLGVRYEARKGERVVMPASEAARGEALGVLVEPDGTEPVSDGRPRVSAGAADLADRPGRQLGRVTIGAGEEGAVPEFVVLGQPDGDGEPIRLAVDPLTRALIVTGAGAEPSATALRVADGANPAQLATVDGAGRLSVGGVVEVSNPVTSVEVTALPPVGGVVEVSNPPADPETGLAKDATLTDGTLRAAIQVAGAPVADGNPVHVAPGTAATWNVSDRPARQLGVVNAQTRTEDAARLHHGAGGVLAVGAATWVTLASISVPAGKTLRLMYAEGDFAELVAITNTRGIRIRKAGTVYGAALTGSDQPNPDMEGLTLTNSSGAAETWELQGRHNSLTSQSMVGWFTWVEVNA